MSDKARNRTRLVEALDRIRAGDGRSSDTSAVVDMTKDSKLRSFAKAYCRELCSGVDTTNQALTTIKESFPPTAQRDLGDMRCFESSKPARFGCQLTPLQNAFWDQIAWGLPVDQSEVSNALRKVVQVCGDIDNGHAGTLMPIFERTLLPSLGATAYPRASVSQVQQAVNFKWLDSQIVLVSSVKLEGQIRDQRATLRAALIEFRAAYARACQLTAANTLPEIVSQAPVLASDKPRKLGQTNIGSFLTTKRPGESKTDAGRAGKKAKKQ